MTQVKQYYIYISKHIYVYIEYYIMLSELELDLNRWFQVGAHCVCICISICGALLPLIWKMLDESTKIHVGVS